tara:strand:- start:935 stop:2542 length:1608 start_codon:yes stop_codon:yes gene_type:complete
MGLEKVIVKQVVKVAKDTVKIQGSLSLMKDKLTVSGLKLVEKAEINPQLLPFDIEALAKGELDDTDDILTPEVLCSFPAMTQAQINSVEKENEILKANLTNTIDNISSLKEALIQIQQPLQILETTSSNLRNVIVTVKAAVKVIKLIPIPTSVPPGVGIPVNIITILSDALDQLDKLLTMGAAITTAIPILVNAILGMISQTIVLIDDTTARINPILDILAFIKAKSVLGDSCPNAGGDGVSQGDIDIIKNIVTSDIQAALAELGESSIAAVNVANEENLIASLQFNSEPPYVYRNFTLTLETEPPADNPFFFPSRRIKGVRYFSSNAQTADIFYYAEPIITGKTLVPLSGPITLYNDPQLQNRYSFSSSVQVLVEEMKYNIDQYLDGLTTRANKFAAINEATEALEIDQIVRGGPLLENVTTNAFGGVIPPYTLNGPNVINIPHSQVEGTITTTVDNVRIVLNVNGGSTSNASITSIFRISQPPKPEQSMQVYVDGYMIGSDSLILLTPGIYEYTLIMYQGGNGAQANFSISTS